MVVRITSLSHRELQVTTASTILIGKISSGLTRLYIPKNCAGVFARSHAAPATSPWTRQLRERWELMKHDLGSLELFGENLYAVHSIEYKRLESYFYVFAVRCLDKW